MKSFFLTQWQRLAVPGLVLLGAACSATSEREGGSVSDPIIGGRLDKGHPAVVAVNATRGQQSLWCSGTIVKVDAATGAGYVLSSARCLRGAENATVSIGDDYAAADAEVHPMIDVTIHPMYDGSASSGYNLAVLRFSGATVDTPVIPVHLGAAFPEDTAVVSVGFGITTRPSAVDPGAPVNTARHALDGKLGGGSEPLLPGPVSEDDRQMGVAYASGSNICARDNGGPVLTRIGGSEHVIGVNATTLAGTCAASLGFAVSTSLQREFIESALSAPLPSGS